MGETVGYEEDVYAWAEQQASALRRLMSRHDLPNELDLVHVAEEIEDVGLSELRAVESFLENILVHLIKLWAEPSALSADHWEGEIFTSHSDLRRRITPAMRRKIDLDGLWLAAVRLASKRLRRSSAPVQARLAALPHAVGVCPWSLDELCDVDFEPASAVRQLPADEA
jgi:hypothetical protein